MIAAEELLKPISAEMPCGVDLSNDAALQALETLARGKPETQDFGTSRSEEKSFSAAEPPNWGEVQTQCLQLFARSKDLRIAVILATALLELDGLSGFRESLALVKGLVERYWATVHPNLDPDDDNDPTQRTNIIVSLATPVGSFGDHLRILDRLRSLPLCNSVQLGRYNLWNILAAESKLPEDGKPVPTWAQIDAAFRDSSQPELHTLNRALTDCIGLVSEIDGLLSRTVGIERAPDLSPLASDLDSMQKRIAPFLVGPATSETTTTSFSSPEHLPAHKAPALNTEIQSRKDVVRLLMKICEYYAQTEPSSPVPLILRRAARLAEMDFIQIIKDMTPEAIAEVRKITGQGEE